MKVLTSSLLIITLVLIAIVICSSDNQTIESESVEKREEVREEIISSAANFLQLSPSLINTCRTGYRLTESGNCRKILRGGSVGVTTEKP